jgi:cytosol alanyl aminopeptidase
VKVTIIAALALVLLAPLRSAAARLGNDVVPTLESIDLQIDPEQLDYSGRVTIEIDVKAPTNTITLHAEDMTITKTTIVRRPPGFDPLTSKMGVPIPILDPQSPSTASDEEGVLTLTAAQTLSVAKYALMIDFENDFGTRAVGLYRMEKDSLGYVFTQFEPDDAREAFPCFDEPIFKIPFELRIDAPESYEVVTNTAIAGMGRVSVPEGQSGAYAWKRITFARTKPMPTYLLAIAVGPLEAVPMEGLGVPGRVVTPNGQSHLAQLATEITPPLLRELESWFGSPYPYDKLDLIAIPEYWPGAMENPGAITYADRILLVDAKAATIGQRRTLSSVTGHELAHMWFGDLVTMEWWDDLWLNETFADWMGDKVTTAVYPELKLEIANLQQARKVMLSDARPSTKPIRRPVDTTDELMEGVGLAYNKGKLVLGMFERWIGPEVFRKGVNEYVRANAWGNATSDDLWAALEHASDKDVGAALGTFIEQPGFPRVTATPQDGGRVRLEQKRFLNAGVEAEPLAWSVPVTLKYSRDGSVHTTTELLTTASQEFTLAGSGSIEWIHPNAGGAGYYAWQVPPAMLQTLATRSRELLAPTERVEFIGNLWLLLDNGALAGDECLRALASFADDPEPQVVSAMIDGLENVGTAFVAPELEDAFAVYVRRTLGPALARFGLETEPGEDEAVTAFRPKLIGWLGDRGRDEKVVAYATEKARAYMADPASIDPSIAGISLELAAMNGDAALFDELVRRFESAQTPADRSRYLHAIGNFRDPGLRDRALDYALTGPLRPNEIFSIPFMIGDRPDGEDVVFAWTLANHDAIAARIPPFVLGFMPASAGGCSAERLAKAQEFFGDPAHQGPGTETTLAKVSDQVTDCVRLREREGTKVAAYLREAAGATAGAGAGAASGGGAGGR